jgi:hypothetical protein
MKRAAILILLLVILASAAASGCASSPNQNDGVFEFGRHVSPEERTAIKAGVKAMQDWALEIGHIHLRRFKVHASDDINSLVSDYNYYHGGDDPLVTAQFLVSGGALSIGDEVYIYVGREWEAYPTTVKSSIAAHETFHVIQYGFKYDDHEHGGAKVSNYPPQWYVEGGADYAAARALDRAGIRPFSEVHGEQLHQSRSYARSLASVSSGNIDHAGGAGAYSVGFLAVEQLAAAHGEAAMFDAWDRLDESPTWSDAFATVYGEPAADFIAAFDSQRASEDDIPRGGISGDLAREDGEPVFGATILACQEPRSPHTCRATWTANDGSFELSLEPGEWVVSYQVTTRKGTEIDDFQRNGDLVKPVSVSDGIVSGLHATVHAPF